MRCPNCNSKLPKGAGFCPGCGVRLDMLKQNGTKQRENEKRKSVIKIILIVIAVLLLMGLLVLGAVFMLKGNRNGEGTEPTEQKSETIQESTALEESIVSEELLQEESTVASESIIEESEMESKAEAEEKPEESEIPVKEMTAEMAYDDILLEYFAIGKMSAEVYQEQASSYYNTNHGAMQRYHEQHDGEFYYTYFDIDQNGTAELLIGYGDETYAMVVDGYAFDGEKAVKIIQEDGGWVEECLLFQDGSYAVMGSNEEAFPFVYVRQLAEDGYSVETILHISVQIDEYGGLIPIGMEALSEEQMMYMEQDHTEVFITDWTPLY